MSVEQVKVAATMADGSMSIISIVVDDGLRVRIDPTVEYIDGIVRKHGDVISWRLITDDDIPKDRTYRNAWKDNGAGKIDHDMTKAKALHYELIRRERGAELSELDNEWMKFNGEGKKKEADEVEAKRKALRDITETLTPAVDAARTIEELFATWPSTIRKPVRFWEAV